MNRFRRYIPTLIFLLSLVASFSLRKYSTHAVVVYVVTIVVLYISFLSLIWLRKTSIGERFSHSAAFFIFSSSAFAFLLFLEQQIFQYLMMALISIILYLYAEYVYRFLFSAASYQVSALSNLSRYMNIFSLFFGSVVMFDIRFFFFLPIYYILAIALVLSWVSMYASIWTDAVSKKVIFGYSSVSSLLFLELVFGVTYLPHIPLVKGIVTVAISYAMMQILRFTLESDLSGGKVFRTVGISTLVIILALATAQWI